MKIKDILGESEVTLKPMPGAQEIDVDGKAVGTATTPQAATAIADLAKKGEFTATDPNATTSEELEDESQGDVVKKVVKLHGKPVGEIGIDPEASPGNGKYYVKHYASGHDTVGFDSAEEALEELRHIVKHSMEENQDLIAQGNQDVGGDPTDEFIKDVETKPHMPGSYQAEDNALLDKMLVIAGLR
jgi:hypothetical protein